MGVILPAGDHFPVEAALHALYGHFKLLALNVCQADITTPSTVISYCELSMYLVPSRLFICVSQTVLPSEQFPNDAIIIYHVFPLPLTRGPKSFLGVQGSLFQIYFAAFFI